MSVNGHLEQVGLGFEVESAAKVTGFSAGQLARWDREGWYRPEFGDPSRRDLYGRIYAFADLLRLRTARALVDHGVPIRRALAVVVDLRTQDWREIPRTTLYVSGRVASARRDEVEAAGKDVTVVEPEEVAAKVADEVRRLAIRTPEQIGATERRRGWVNGWEVFAGTRIPMLTIVGLMKDGWPRSEILESYDRLRDADLDLAEARLEERYDVAS